MMKFETPVVEIKLFEVEDVITASVVPDNGEDQTPDQEL